MRKNLLLSVALSVAVGGCMVGEDYKKPKSDAPAQFAEGHQGPRTQPAAVIDLTKWWKTLNDPDLESLINRAVETNFDIQTAEANVRAARAQLGVEQANLFPTVDASAGYTKSRASKNSFGSGGGGGSGSGI